MTTFVLRSDVDSIDLFSSGTFEIIDESLQISSPEREDVRVATHRRIAGRTLRYSAYRSRKVTFTVRVKDISDVNVSKNVQRISAMLYQSSAETALAGGMYNPALTINGNDTGDHGVVLKFCLGDNSQNITWELDGQTHYDPNIYTLRVLTGDIIQHNISNTARTFVHNNVTYYYRMLDVSLECEPMFMLPSRIVGHVGGDGLFGGPVQPDTGYVNRIIVGANDVVGDAEALTRISTQLQGAQGVIIARDAGVSILNSTTHPVYTKASGTTYNDMYCWADLRISSGLTIDVKISSVAPDKCQYRFSGGSWSTDITINAGVPINLGGSGIWVVFYTSSGHILNDMWSFKSNQAYFPANVNTDAYANRASLYSDDGLFTASWIATVPPNCTSKYKVLVLRNESMATEYKLQASFLGYSGSSGRVTTGTQTYDWVLPPTQYGYVDLGVIDLSPAASSFMLHPGIVTEIGINVYTRSNDTIASGNSINITGMYLIPCQDEYAYFHGVWNYDGSGYEVYSNYDSSYPYIAETAFNPYVNSITRPIGTTLNATYAGNVITLVPNVDNTILILPIFSASTTDWRSGSTITNSSNTGTTYIAIRPRYLQV